MKNFHSITALAFAAVIIISRAASAIDYSDPARWINIPSTYKPVDVIYLYPTAWQAGPADPLYCDIDNTDMTSGATAVYDRQATAFESVANVYAPFYRQMNISKTLGSMTNEELEETIAAVPAKDVTEALDYYFAHHNNGRPFILAGHSQGTQVMMVAMAEYFQKHPELRDRMVASYLIGYSVTDDFLEENGLRFATGADDSGVVVSWNTEAPGTTGSPVVLPGALAINPLNWKTDATYAGIDGNLGSFMPDADGVYHLVPGMADAWVDPVTGTLKTSVDPAIVDSLPPPFPAGSFHGYDYQFYYVNLMQNALTRSLTHLNRPYAALYSASLRTGVHAVRAFQNAVPSFSERRGPGNDEQSVLAADTALFSTFRPNRTGMVFFASPFGNWMKQRNHAGYAGYDIDGGGIAVGAARHWEALTMGIATGYSRQRTRLTGMDGRVDADMLHTAVFAEVRLGDFIVEASAGYGRSWNDAERSTPYGGLGPFSYAAEFTQTMWSASVRAGYEAALPNGFRLIPSVGLDAVSVRSGVIVESGTLAAFRLEKSRYTSVETPFSIRLEKRISRNRGSLTPWIEAAWIPELGDRRPEATVRFTGNSAAGAFRSAAAASRSRGRAAAGVRGEIGRVSLQVGYSFEFSGSSTNHGIQAGIGMAF